MTASAMCLAGIGLLCPIPVSHGVSPDAERLSEAVAEAWEQLFQSVSLVEIVTTALSELESLRQESAQANWDGYGANPLDIGAYEQAVRFLMALPTTTPAPSIGIDPDGEVELGWDSGPRRMFSVSVGPTGRLTYAGLFGMSRSYGTEWMDAEIPRPILQSVARVFALR